MHVPQEDRVHTQTWVSGHVTGDQKVMRSLPAAVPVFHMVAVLVCACIYLSPEADAACIM